MNVNTADYTRLIIYDRWKTFATRRLCETGVPRNTGIILERLHDGPCPRAREEYEIYKATGEWIAIV